MLYEVITKAGRTFVTTGPMLEFTVDGQLPGDEIHLPTGGGFGHGIGRNGMGRQIGQAVVSVRQLGLGGFLV